MNSLSTKTVTRRIITVNEKQLAILATMAKGWFGNSQQHSVHAEIIRQKGYHKLADIATTYKKYTIHPINDFA